MDTRDHDCHRGPEDACDCDRPTYRFEVKQTEQRVYYKDVEAFDEKDAIDQATQDQSGWMFNDSDSVYEAYRRD